MISQIKIFAAKLGWRTALLYLLHRGCDQLNLPIKLRAYRLVAQRVQQSPRLSAKRAEPYTSRFLEAGDPDLERMPLSREVLDFRFDQGARCLGLFRGGSLVAYLWLCRGAYEEDEVRCRFRLDPPENTIWDFDVYVMPGCRASFAFPALWDAADAYLRERGIAWSLSRISAFNLASVSSHQALGAREVGRATFFGAGPLQLTVSSLRPHLHFLLSHRSRPEIRVAAPKG